MTAAQGLNWFLIAQGVIVAVLTFGVIGLFRFGGAVEKWYHLNERRLVQLELARVRHALRLERVEDHLEETCPGRFMRRRVEDLVSSEHLKNEEG
jgi:hypothetical protein